MDTQEFRQHYRATEIPKLYNGYLHGAFTASVTLGAAIYCFSHLDPLSASDWLLIPAMIILSNLVEYVLHRGLLHHRLPGSEISFRIHTLQHHRYYTHEAAEFGDSRDLHMVFFPFWAPVLMIIILTSTCYTIPSAWMSTQSRYLIVAMGALYFLFYEVMHFFHHLPDSHPLTRVPGLRFMRAHHRHHHNPRYMTTQCFNVTLPFFDFLLKTRQKPSA